MHINNDQFCELLADIGDLELEEVKKSLEELVSEIKQSLAENEAYEIEGFGIFSSIGNRIMFIPSKELETEINFKYVGMEPIEVDGGIPLDDTTPEVEESAAADEDDTLSRFSGLIDDEDLKAIENIPEDAPGPDEWGVTAHKEDASADRLFASLMGESVDESDSESDESESVEETFDQTEDDPFSGLEEEAEEESSDTDLESDLADLMGSDAEPVDDSVSIDDELDSIFSDDEVEEDSNALDLDVFGEDSDEDDETESEEESELDEEEAVLFDDSQIEDALDDVIGELEEDEDEGEAETETESEEIELEDDPFSNLEDESAEEEDLEEEGTETEAPFDLEEMMEEPVEDILDLSDADSEEEAIEAVEEAPAKDKGRFGNLEHELDESEKQELKEVEEIIPVITNIASENLPDKKEVAKKEEEEAKKKEKAEKEKKPKKEKKKKTSSEPAPAWLYMVLLLLVFFGATFAVGYFNVVNIPFITEMNPAHRSVNTPTTVPAQPQAPANTLSEANATPLTEAERNAMQQQQQAQQGQNQNATQPEQEVEEVSTPAQTQGEISGVQANANNPNKYGLNGVASEAANDGYTIVLFSLTNRQNALAQQQKFADMGYRSILATLPSERYGTLYRVSIGQFASLFDAAEVAEGIEDTIPDNYYIKKIN